MTKHGAEDGLPLTPLAQWMRETTGIQGHEDDFMEFTVVERVPNILRVTPNEGFPVPSVAVGEITQDPALQELITPSSWEFDKGKLYQAARDAVESYINEGHTQDEILTHEKRIWALHDKLLGDDNGKGTD
jgi:hypothetical protein